MSEELIAKHTGEWGNIYTDASARDSVVDVIRQLAITGIELLVLYSGHYPVCQVEMIQEIAETFDEHPSITVIPFSECLITQGDHAGISETSLMLYLGKDLVDTTRITSINYQDHGWETCNSPERASAARGEADVDQIITYLKEKVDRALSTE